MKLFLKHRDSKYDAEAEYDLQTGDFVVLEGSRVSESVSTAPSFRGSESIKKQRDLYVENNIVQKNVRFRSPSTAGNFVTGSSTNGLMAWRDKTGKELKILLLKFKE